jgi:HD-GYP domain-containing protein (c-di-GMP phosphodiesterase class II)
VSASSTAVSLETELVAASRERALSRLSQRERVTHLTSAITFSVAATVLALSASESHQPWLLLVLFAASVAVASRVELEVGSGFTTPVELVIVPMLFALPPAEVPIVVALGLICGQLPDYVRRRVPLQRVLVSTGNAAYTLAPASVFVFADGRASGADEWAAVTAVALCSQFVLDSLLSTVREYCAVGISPRVLVRPLAWTFFVDSCFAPVGFAAGLAGSVWTAAYALPLPTLLLIRLFAHERASRLSQALELSVAYRGTALLLGDVVEADDAYTGAHSREVVDLVLGVADHLRLDQRSRSLAELTALLHDVGKIKIPKEIINKNGPLTAEERAIINTHTIEGERLLSQVGGLLSDVGRIVRSCHERYDGYGYPDGLAGDDIPLVARIVCCCDALNAMTTTRPYRNAMSNAEARAELLQNRATQFDPDVVDAIIAITGT